MMAKTRAVGADARFRLAFETDYGTAPDGSGGGVYQEVPFKSVSLGAEKPLGEDPLLGKGRDAQDPYYDATDVAGDISVPVDLRDFGFWLKALFGDPTTTGASAPYTHEFVSGGDVPSFTGEIAHTQLGATGKFFLEKGVVAGGLSFDLSRTGPLNASLSLIAQGETESNAAEDVAPLTNELRRFSQGNGAIKVGGAQLANVTGGRFNFSNSLEAIKTIRSDGLIDGVDPGEAMAEGSVNLRFSTDTTLSTAIDAETPVALEFEHTMSGGYSLKYHLPRVFLPKKKNEIGGPGGIAATYDFKAAYDETAGYMCKVTLVNDVADY